MSTRIVHVNDQVDGAVYIGRRMNRRRLLQSPFANPFPVALGRSAAIRAYRQHLIGHPDLFALLVTLRDKPLACWCRHDGEPRTEATAYHGDELVAILDRYTDAELRDVTEVWQWLAAPR